MTESHDLQRAVAAFARDILEGEDESSSISVITHEVVKHFAAVDGAGISLVDGRNTIRTLGATDTFVEAADRFQHEIGEGPCVDALRREARVHSPDLEHDDRWPRWSKPVVQELGVRSVLAHQLFVHEREVGALNLYSRTPQAFGSDEIEETSFFAAHAAVAVASARTVDQLKHGMARRTLIGQAEGILMERYALDAQQAFALLRRVSQDRNVKLYDVAESLVRTRRIPDPSE